MNVCPVDSRNDFGVIATYGQLDLDYGLVYGGGMKLKRSEVQRLIDDVIRKMPCDDCRTCDCFIGFITRLELDSQDDVRDITNPLKVLNAQIHGCIGCNPCPPAEAFTNYIQNNLVRL